ncbi:MAG: nucleotidyltransferase family protein [Acidobacteriota bacterium]|nr:nucleotidyltransferase family protein [Acidobacteriota bacterium]
MQLTATDKLLLNCLLPTEASAARLRQLPLSELDWSAALCRAEFHSIASLLRFNLAQSDSLNLLPEAEKESLRVTSQTWAARHLAYVSEAARLIAALKVAGITAIPLKGAALMLGGYYPQAGLRAALDMDLLVAPEKQQQADEIIAALGYEDLPGRRSVPQRQRLANELNHLWPRRGPSGLIVELHRRAFQFTQAERDFTFAEVHSRAASAIVAGAELLLPAPTDLAFHLVHHTLVDLQTTKAILRTIADLYFIFAAHPEAREAMIHQADEFGFGGAARLANDLVALLAEVSENELQAAANNDRFALILETALTEETLPLADAARLFEYLDFSRQPMAKLGNLTSLLFTSRQHLTELYGQTQQESVYWNYLRRPFDLLRKFDRAGFSPSNLLKVWKLRKLARGNDEGRDGETERQRDGEKT